MPDVIGINLRMAAQNGQPFTLQDVIACDLFLRFGCRPFHNSPTIAVAAGAYNCRIAALAA
jgi:hypothetical protein